MISIESKFINLFDGRKDVRGTIDGKSIKEPLGHIHITNHLFGDESLGVYPLLDNGTCKWAVVDFDFKTDPDRCINAEIEASKFTQKLFGLGISGTWFERSKSGMIHLWIFFSDFIDVYKIRKILFHVAHELDLEVKNGVVEIFPKQDNLVNGGVGNYIHLPYFGALNGQDIQNRTMINTLNQKPISIEKFLQHSDKRLITPDNLYSVYDSIFEEDSNQNAKRNNDSQDWYRNKEKIIKTISKYWKEGQRQDLAMSLAGFLAKKDADWGKAQEIILEIAKLNNDNETSQRIGTIKSTFEKAKKEEPILGYKGLEKILNTYDLEKLTKPFEIKTNRTPLTVADILSTYVEESQFIIQNFLMKRAITVLSGDPGIGKTWLCLEICRCINEDQKLFNIFDTRQARITYFDQENPRTVLKNRLILLNATNINILFYHYGNFNIESDFDEIIKIAEKSDLLIFDSFIQFHSRNEDRAYDIKNPMNKLKSIADQNQCAILLIHQNRKPGQFERNELYSARGSMQIIYEADMAFSLRKVKNEGRVLECTKSRLVEEPKPIKFDIESDENGKIKLVYLGQYDEFISKKERAKFRILSILESATEPLPNEEIHKKLAESGMSIGLSTLKPMLKELENIKIINSKNGLRGKKFYYINNEGHSES